jgi:hypothetical protein
VEISSEQLGTGGAILVAVLGLILRRNKAAKHMETAGEKSPEWWTQEFERISERAVRNALMTRNEDIRRIVREEIERASR